MRTPLSSCSKNLVSARGDGDGCIKTSVSACGTLLLISFRLFCDSVGGRRDNEGGMNAGDENCAGRSGVKGGIPPLLDMLAGSEVWFL